MKDKLNAVFTLILFAGLSGNLRGEDMNMLKPEKIPYRLEKHSDVRIDNYYWMKERDSQKVKDYLNGENDRAEKIMSDTQDLQKKLYKEMRGRIKENDSTVPYREGAWLYWREYKKGKDYPLYYRKPAEGGATELLLDPNKLAEGKDFFHLKPPVFSPDGRFMAYACDFTGRRFYTFYFMDLQRKKELDEKIENSAGNGVWAADNKTFFYVKQDTQTLRWDRVFSRAIGEGPSEREVYFEKDPAFEVSVSKSLTGNFIFLNSISTLTTEVRYLKSDEPQSPLSVFYPREKGLEYSVEDGGNGFYVLNNREAKNFKVSFCHYSSTSLESWKEVEPQGEGLIEELDVFSDYLVISTRKDALITFKVISRGRDSAAVYASFPESAYSAYPLENRQYGASFFRYAYESPSTPPSVYEMDMATGRSRLIKTEKVPNFKKEKYSSQRLWVTARDGAKIPVTLLYSKEHMKNREKRLFVYGYGSYGYSTDADFNPNIFSLIDRGFAYAVIHVRGGSELGRKWYEDGRQLKKLNTFYDFIDATKWLVEEGWGRKGEVFAYGASAGGLLMGAVANMDDGLYGGIIAGVPFVDVLTTMLDDTIPLTTGEYDEWGDPNVREYYDYMKLYSPYDNVSRKCYPNMLITAGYHDSQVQYWEPAKWAAKLRDYNSCASAIILKTDMSAGHGGKSGRFEYLKEVAFRYAFILKFSGIGN